MVWAGWGEKPASAACKSRFPSLKRPGEALSHSRCSRRAPAPLPLVLLGKYGMGGELPLPQLNGRFRCPVYTSRMVFAKRLQRFLRARRALVTVLKYTQPTIDKAAIIVSQFLFKVVLWGPGYKML